MKDWKNAYMNTATITHCSAKPTYDEVEDNFDLLSVMNITLFAFDPSFGVET